MVKRDYWIKKIEDLWERRSIIWLAGVRRSGKTSLCNSLSDVLYFDCELPATRNRLEDPEFFLKTVRGKRLVLDEIHRLENPSEILKIAADHFPDTKVIATGSSTLSASKKFRDTLTGRKFNIHLTPLLSFEGELFGNVSLTHRFLFGGLPPFFIKESLPELEYNEWIESYWAKDIQELFRVGKRNSFIKCVELLFGQSGSMFEATRFTAPAEVSRPTVNSYISVIESTFVAKVVRPFSYHRATEIVSAPKIYAFDTGFVCYYKGWHTLQPENYGILWEHIVLNDLVGCLPLFTIHYWRNKQGHEIDFVLSKTRNHHPIAIECKWKSATFDPKNLEIFRKNYPEGLNFVVAPDIETTFQKKYGEIIVTFISLKELVAILLK